MNISDITIIVPTKNESKHIPRFLTSLPPEVPLCLVDVSSDETADLAIKLRKENTTILHDQARIKEARNYASVQAQTRWLLFTDADVSFAPDYFSHLAKINPRGAVYGTKQPTGEQGLYNRSISGWQFWLDRLGIPVFSGSNLLVEKYIFHEVGGFVSHLLAKEDIEIGFQIRRAGFPIRFDPGLRVFTLDLRQLPKDTLRKDLHTLSRCASIYLNLFPALWRAKDWDYW